MNRHFLSPRMLLGLVVAAPAAIAMLPHTTQAQTQVASVAPQVMDAASASGVPNAPGTAATYGRLQVTSSSQAVTPRAQQALEQSLAQASTPEGWGEASQRDYDANRDDNRDARYDYRPGRRSRGGS